MAVRRTFGKGLAQGSRALRFEQLETRQMLSGAAQGGAHAAADDAEVVAETAANGGGTASVAAVAPRQMEYLDRGLVVVRQSTSQAYVGWRLLGNDPSAVAFNLYRVAAGGEPVKLNDTPLTTTTDFVDATANFSVANTYYVRPVLDNVELDPSESFTLPAAAPVQQYFNVPLQIPTGGTVTLPAGTQIPPEPPEGGPAPLEYTYTANDASVGDLDGDGDYEIVLKWDPTNSRDNAHEGLTGNTIIDAYQIDGTLLWRIDLGRNIRSGAHYTQFLVYDFDGDGRAEVVMKTADGTIDGNGQLIGSAAADYRDGYTGGGDTRWGRILSGPEYLTVFDGATGAALSTIPFPLARVSASQWGDSYGNRMDRFNATVAYLDGERPSIVWARGYYGPQSGSGQARNEIVALDWRDGELTQRWLFRAGHNINGNINSTYIGQGNHNISVADVDGDGKDEIIYGSAVIDDNGAGLYSTGRGHGDALHVSDMDPTRPGLEIFSPHESPSSYGNAGGDYRDALTGELIVGIPSTGDVGRGVAFDIDANHPGYEFWASVSGTRMVYNVNGSALYSASGLSSNFGVWWDADPLRELLDGNRISEWRYQLSPPSSQTLLTMSGTSSNNGTKSTPSLSADLFGDWREEVVMKTTDSSALRIYTTVIPSTMRLFTLMHDSQYRSAIAWQNSAYNQPPHPSFFLGAGMAMPPQPSIYFPGDLPGDYNADSQVDSADYSVWRDALGSNMILPNDTTPGTVSSADYEVWKSNFGATSNGAAALAAIDHHEEALEAYGAGTPGASSGIQSISLADAVHPKSIEIGKSVEIRRAELRSGPFVAASRAQTEPLLLLIAKQRVRQQSEAVRNSANDSASDTLEKSAHGHSEAFAELGQLLIESLPK